MFFFSPVSLSMRNFMKHRNVLLRSLLQTASSRRASVEMEEPKRANGDLFMDGQGRQETVKSRKCMVHLCINNAECLLRSDSVQASGGLSQDTGFSQAVLEGGVATAIGPVPPQHN